MAQDAVRDQAEATRLLPDWRRVSIAGFMHEAQVGADNLYDVVGGEQVLSLSAALAEQIMAYAAALHPQTARLYCLHAVLYGAEAAAQAESALCRHLSSEQDAYERYNLSVATAWLLIIEAQFKGKP